VAGGDDDVIDPASDPDMAVHVPLHTITSKLLPRGGLELDFLKPFFVAPDAPGLPGPPSFKTQFAIHIIPVQFLIGVDVQDC